MHSVVVSRFLRKEKASGSNPDVSNFYIFLIKFMCFRGFFKEDIYKKCILCKKADNELIDIVNKCEESKREREVVLKQLNKINNVNYDDLSNAIEYNYYNKRYENKN